MLAVELKPLVVPDHFEEPNYVEGYQRCQVDSPNDASRDSHHISAEDKGQRKLHDYAEVFDETKHDQEVRREEVLRFHALADIRRH